MHNLKTPLNFSVLCMSVCNNHLATMDCNMYCKHEHIIFTPPKPTVRGHPLPYSLNWTEFPFTQRTDCNLLPHITERSHHYCITSSYQRQEYKRLFHL